MLASGSGTNVQNFIRYFEDHPMIEIALVISENPHAFVLQRAEAAGIPTLVIPRTEWAPGEVLLKALADYSVDFIVLAGFLRLIPQNIIKTYPRRIVNIHPALLPRYGGKGMYGMRVHQAVIDASEAVSGITIHLVNEHYDEGAILFQAEVEIKAGETPDSLAQKVHKLEYAHYPVQVEEYLLKGINQ